MKELGLEVRRKRPDDFHYPPHAVRSDNGWRAPPHAEPIDELVQRWKQSPSPAATIALCDALRATPRGPLVQQVGDFATQRHATDVGVLIAVARMYMETHRSATRRRCSWRRANRRRATG